MGDQRPTARGWIGALALLAAAAVVPLLPAHAASADPAPLTITSPEAIPSATLGVKYTYILKATGGTTPYRWTLASGSDGLPPGIVLGSSGNLVGTTNIAGWTNPTVQVTDASGRTATKRLFLPAVDPPSIDWPDPFTAYRGVPYGGVGEAGAFRLWGGMEPFTWSLASGSLPAGVEVLTNPGAGDFGWIQGTPTELGTWDFTIRVTDRDGRTATQVGSITVDEPTPPAVPDGLYVHSRNVLVWNRPDGGGSPITGYRVTPYTEDGTALDPVVVSSNSFEAGYLRRGTFTFTVAAISAFGTSGESEPSPPLTVIGPPDAMSRPTVRAGDRSATVSWDAPYDGGTPIGIYRVMVSGPGADGRHIDVPGDVLSTVVTGLTPGGSYTFTVFAWSDIGPGSASPPSDSVTPFAAPGAPSGLAASPGDRRAVLRWTASTNANFSPITGYQVTPYIEGVAQAPVPVGLATAATVTGLENGTTYTFTVAAVNEAGPSEASAPSNAITASATPIPPSAPFPISALAGDGNARISWTIPMSTGGSPIAGYVVTPYVGDVPGTPTTFRSTATSQTVPGLENGTTYTFRIAAVNAAGTGEASAPTAAVIAGTPNPPGFAAAQPGNKTAKVSWMAPASNGSPITGYVITPYEGPNPQAPQVFTGTATSVTVTGLLNGPRYTFAVAAVNARGTGPESVTEPIWVGTATAPSWITAVPTGPTSVRLSWVASDTYGAPVWAHRITPYIGTTAQTPTIQMSAATTATISGLTPGTTYTFQIMSMSDGWGYSAPGTSGAVTPGAPGPPGFQAASPGDRSAVVRFTAPPPNGSPVTSFTVWPVTGGKVLAAQTFDTPSATSLTVTGLTNGTSYTFRVATTNAVGSSPQVATNAVVVGTPNAPGFPAAQPGNSTAKVAWLSSAANGAPVTGYVVTPYRGSTALSPMWVGPTATSVIVPGLSDGTTYTFRVTALNAFGASVAGTTAAITVGTPTAPLFPRATGGDGSATVSGAAAANGAPITAYTVTPMRGSVALPAQIFAGSSTTWLVTGLENGVEYTFKVTATNAYGTGPPAGTPAIVIGPPA